MCTSATRFSKPPVARPTLPDANAPPTRSPLWKRGPRPPSLRHGRETPAAAQKRAAGGSGEGSPQDRWLFSGALSGQMFPPTRALSRFPAPTLGWLRCGQL